MGPYKSGVTCVVLDVTDVLIDQSEFGADWSSAIARMCVTSIRSLSWPSLAWMTEHQAPLYDHSGTNSVQRDDLICSDWSVK